MAIKRTEKPSEVTRSPLRTQRKDRYRRDSLRRDVPTAEVYTHPRYVPQLRDLIKAKMDEFHRARATALDAIDQRIQELSRTKHEMDPAIATELMVTLAEARATLLSLNPVAQDSQETLTVMSDRLRALVSQQRSRPD